MVKGAKQPNGSKNSRDARLSNCLLESCRSGGISGKGTNVRWWLCQFQCRPSVFHNRPSSAEDTSSGGRSVNASRSLLAHFLRAKPPVLITSVSLGTSCRVSSTPLQLVVRPSPGLRNLFPAIRSISRGQGVRDATRCKCSECRERSIRTSCLQPSLHAPDLVGNARGFISDVGPDERFLRSTVENAVDQPLLPVLTVDHRSNDRQEETDVPNSRGEVDAHWSEFSRDSVRSPILWFRTLRGCDCWDLLLVSCIRLRRSSCTSRRCCPWGSSAIRTTVGVLRGKQRMLT
ncbi:hypothetical protein T07_7275 [Trichinella nelsoni]|uniref:Uncharacterized protein n=1 Tax=Trichinella nelsoni TaxID=6336 RepID=A0A0V0SDS1_9BILA|nr:hypothetical protein T07_7275 [Trichinella nelsoni]